MTSIGSPPERAQRAERCVDDTGVRARRDHTDASAAHAGREEALVEDQLIRDGPSVAHRVVSDEPRLVRRHTCDLAADEEEARKDVRLFVLRDAPTGVLERLERRLRVQQHQRAGSGHGATLVGPVWV